VAKQIIYTQHAEERFKMRGISKNIVEKSINNPDETFKKE